MKFRHCLLKILKNQNVANGRMEAMTDGGNDGWTDVKKVYPPTHAQFAGGGGGGINYEIN